MPVYSIGMIQQVPGGFHCRPQEKVLLTWAGVCLFMASLATGREVRGTITAIDATQPRVTLQEKGRQWEATVDLGDWKVVRVGQAVRADLLQHGDGWRLERVWPDDANAQALLQTLGRRLRLDTEARGKKAFRNIGESIPRFALWNQRGELIESSNFRGRFIVLNFVFTRCTQPNMCPASTRKMKALQELLKEAGISNVLLCSISLDPEFDTPGVMRQYIEDYGIDGANFHFLSGPVRMVEDLKIQLGVLAEEDEQLIVKHTLMTILISPEGKIIYQVPGSSWSPEDFLLKIRQQPSTTTPTLPENGRLYPS